MSAEWSPWFHRLRHWQGQVLRSLDLNDQVQFDAFLRAWHTRAMHAAYGVRFGLQVTPDASSSTVTVAPGLAFDARGRELILADQESISLPSPPFRSAMTLMIGHAASSLHACHKTPGEACLPGKSPASKPTLLSWVRTDRLDPRQGIALARVKASRGQISTRRSALHAAGPRREERFEIDQDFVPLRARPHARPRIGRGATIPGNTSWRLWRRDIETGPNGDLVFEADESAHHGSEFILSEATSVTHAVVQPPREPHIFGLEVDVDTSASGFTAVPCYQAWLEGELWNSELLDRFSERRSVGYHTSAGNLWRVADGLILLQLLKMRFGHIHRPTATGFTYRLWFPQISKWVHSRSLFEYLLLLAHQGAITVAWVGVQETSEPVFEPVKYRRSSWKDC